MTLTKTILTAAVALLTAGAAQAMPTSTGPIQDAPHGQMMFVRGGCGFGAHRGPYAGCRLNHGPRGAIRRAVTGAPRGCLPGHYRVRGVCR